MRAAAALLDLAHDAARHVVAGEQLGRAARVLVALACSASPPPRCRRSAPCSCSGMSSNMKRWPSLVAQHAALAAHALGDQDAAHARRPDHAGGVELHELHVHQLGAGVVGERVAVAGVLPAVAGDLVGAADAAGGEHHRLGAEDAEAAALAVVAEGAGDAVAVLEQRRRPCTPCGRRCPGGCRGPAACGSSRGRCGRRRGPGAGSGGRRSCAAGCGRPGCGRRPRPRPRARARGRAPPWRAARPCASC